MGGNFETGWIRQQTNFRALMRVALRWKTNLDKGVRLSVQQVEICLQELSRSRRDLPSDAQSNVQLYLMIQEPWNHHD